MQIIVKQSQHRIDPKHPQSTDPRYADALRAGRERMERGELTFQSEGQKRDYERIVAANPGNVPGLPAFFPPMQIKSLMGGITPMASDEVREYKDKLTVFQRRSMKLDCYTCKAVTEHSISPDECYCRQCGTFKPWRSA